MFHTKVCALYEYFWVILIGINMPSRWDNISKVYMRYERHVSSISLLSGFVFDAVTLKRVDLFMENFWIVAHLLVVAIGIIILNMYENKQIKKENTRARFWMIFMIQFAFGGLFSTFLVFYFRSATLATSWPFLLILGLVFCFNEIFKHHYSRLSFQVSIFFIALFSFAIYFVPVLVHQIGDDVFILSGVASLISIWLFIRLLAVTTREKFRESAPIIILSIGGIFIAINALYFYNFIPPIPLSLKDAGVFHSLVKNGDGNYVAGYESRSVTQEVKDYLRSYQDFHEAPDDPIYAYSAIFSPSSLNINVIHEWQYYDETAKAWKTTDRINLPIVGGRDGGFRTYSMRAGLTPGLWRVNIKTENGKLIGRLKFNVQLTDTDVQMESGIR